MNQYTEQLFTCLFTYFMWRLIRLSSDLYGVSVIRIYLIVVRGAFTYIYVLSFVSLYVQARTITGFK